jgi:hypothetical protein
MTARRPRLAAVLAFNLALVVAGLVTLELVFGHWFKPNLTDRLNLVRDSQLRFDARLLYDGADHVVYTRDAWGLRGTYPSLDDIDVITLGGSATDQRYITDGSTWQDVIVREFAAEGRTVSVVNAGVDGQSTYGHIKDFDWWFPTLPEFKPRYVLFYIGGNDIFKGNDSSFDDLVNEKPPTWKTHFRERSALFHLAHTAVGIYRARRVHKISHRRDPPASYQWTTRPLARDYRAFTAPNVDRYRKAVALLAAKTRALGATPIFVTQSLSLYRFREDGVLEGRVMRDDYGGTPINGVDYYYVMREFWRATMEECARAGGVCIDAGNEVAWRTGDFYDSIHNTPQGAERLGKYLHSRLRDLRIGTHEVAH